MAFHQWEITEVYSNEDGSMQFIELFTTGSNERFIADHTITFNPDTGDTRTYTVPTDLTSGTAGKRLLFATEAFSDVVDADFILPDGFLDPDGGNLIVFGVTVDSLDFDALPLTGTQSLNGSGGVVTYSPTNFVGDSVMIGTNAGTNMSGGAGKDDISGLGGHDTLNGGVDHDILDGGSGNDRLIGGTGNDILDGGAGTDNLNGGDGKDVLVWGAGDILNGGVGTDRMRIVDASVDLSNNVDNPNSRLLDIEQVDLRGNGDQVLTLAKKDVLAMSTTDKIKIFGDAGDTVEIVGEQGEGTDLGNGFFRYTVDTAILDVAADITVV
jgi:Ca2+-binding RTX toxin-like protein